MSQQHKQTSIFPKKLLWRLTITNVIIISLFVALSGLAIYRTACFLVGDLSPLQDSTSQSFNVQLFRYLLIFSFIAIILGSIIHLYVTKALIHPLQKLIDSTLEMKRGNYPLPIPTKSDDEIGQLTTHFNDLITELKNNEKKRDKLLADLSHELRTPLANLNGYLSALKDGVIQGDAQLYASLQNEVKRITEMMDQLTHLNEWGMNNEVITLDKRRINIAEQVQQNINMFTLMAQEKNISFHVNIEDAFIEVNEEGFTQVVSNIIENALQYSEGKDPIEVVGKIVEDHYELGIKGRGKAIESKDLPYIFDRFYRVDQSRTRQSGGSGLGLAISREIVEQHGGLLKLDTDGSLHHFRILLPL